MYELYVHNFTKLQSQSFFAEKTKFKIEVTIEKKKKTYSGFTEPIDSIICLEWLRIYCINNQDPR